MNPSMTWLDAVRGTDSIREVARRIGSTHATVNRQAADDALSFEIVRAISRAYGRPVLADLVQLGHLTAADLGVSDIDNALRAASEEELVVEIGRRLGVAGTVLFDAPITAAVATASNVVGHGRFPATDVGASDQDQEAVARTKDQESGEDTE